MRLRSSLSPMKPATLPSISRQRDFCALCSRSSTSRPCGARSILDERLSWASTSSTFEGVGPVSTSLRWRYFGPRNLVEDASVKSAASSAINAEASYALSRRVRVILEAFNLLDTDASDIDYFYVSRLPGEPAHGVWDVHSHPTLPRTLRIGLSVGL
jgi:hypothetical protein